MEKLRPVVEDFIPQQSLPADLSLQSLPADLSLQSLPANLSAQLSNT
jgi:hypothetical protein